VTGVRAAAAPLASPAFRRYLAGQLPSVTCSWAQVITLSWVVVGPRAPFLLGAGAAVAAAVIAGASRHGVPRGERHGVADGGARQGYGAIVTDHGGAELG
jgi:hypothetical protein